MMIKTIVKWLINQNNSGETLGRSRWAGEFLGSKERNIGSIWAGIRSASDTSKKTDDTFRECLGTFCF